MKKATQTTGKQGELRVIGELLKQGFDIYLPLVDIGGIDCIIRTEVGYKEIQIKTREKISTSLLFDVKKFEPRNNFFIVCHYINEPDIYWVLPSKVFKENARNMRTVNRLRIILGSENSEMRRKLHIYRNNFFQLREGTQEATRQLKETAKKSGWQALKQYYPTVQAVEKKLKEARKTNLSPGYIQILENLKKYWKKNQ